MTKVMQNRMKFLEAKFSIDKQKMPGQCIINISATGDRTNLRQSRDIHVQN